LKGRVESSSGFSRELERDITENCQQLKIEASLDIIGWPIGLILSLALTSGVRTKIAVLPVDLANVTPFYTSFDMTLIMTAALFQENKGAGLGERKRNRAENGEGRRKRGSITGSTAGNTIRQPRLKTGGTNNKFGYCL
jgi:hypothetical protein